jgi:ADP-heptose:LPS heptosyltransferase
VPPRDPRGGPLGDARRLLVIRHRAAGDLLLTTPALRALRAALPSARIDVLVARGLGSLLEGNPDVTRAIEFDRRSLRSQAGLYLRLARGGYDAVVDLVSNPRSAWMTALTRARVRAGYDIPGRSWAYTVAVPRERVDAAGPVPRYAPEASLDLIGALGIPDRGLELTMRVAPRAEQVVDDWLHAQGIGTGIPVFACLPAGSWPAKTWLPERFAGVMDAFSGEGEVLWLWGPGERDLAEECRGLMRGPSRVAPPLGWQELAAFLRRCALWVGNDSGPKHVAVALGVPTVTIFGPTHPGTWHPPRGPHALVEAAGLDCLHCNANRCPLPGERHLRCMRDVTVERVVEAARALLGGAGAAERTPCASR